ncbi:hypothetical protein [Pseudomaricurvus sp. HS19]|uniref:hypothetical protein n=1 Tax=Pseudomaricurvus sp. HS19 TaxID=2692626 RepID=UPI00136D4FAC|nr:hypothetical protein [Pseudomaricurvus sp. HS19]MYM62169.1 hypothetical protein [Pseudomaricurvus sp. HS19]
MSKNLSQSELNVLQENLDLFSAAAPAPAAPEQKAPDTAAAAERAAAPEPKPRRPIIQRDKSRSGNPRQATAAIRSRKQAPAQKQQEATSETAPCDQQATAIGPAAPAPASTTAATAAIDGSSNYSASGRQILGVRSSSAVQAREWLSGQGISIENYAIEKRDPALRNLAEALLDRGVEYRIEGRALEWFLVSSEQPSSELLLLPGVEVAFSVDWFESRKAHIRRLKGGDYIDACGAIADHLPLRQRQPETPAPA